MLVVDLNLVIVFTSHCYSMKMPPQRQRRRLTVEELARCIGMLKYGARQRHVAELLGVSQSVVAELKTGIKLMVQLLIDMEAAEKGPPRSKMTVFS